MVIELKFKARKRKLTESAQTATTATATATTAAFGHVFGLQDDQESTSPRQVHKKPALLEDSASKVQHLKNEGNTLADAGRFRAAMARWLEAVDIAPTNAVLHELLAQGAMAIGEDFRAVQFASKAVELAPDWGDAHLTLARCHMNYGELRLAKKNFNQTPEIEDDLRDVDDLLEKQAEALRKRDEEAAREKDEDKWQVITCFRNLSLRGQTKPT
ncbi:TPA: hypothetical protein N0F65_001207 [Lagenidium giganteum]|uniref:Tetratricopeptide repeat protein 33 n=1 Tax=Lagenidium giganteum TaxID=4803 RepID=A0AAV2Z387_9STRA|nr:TPA: hypothetical protein N0F65_001207 [Lagenidium giganteum]